nr:unnamed protein product [Callosobruchus analis]CAI5852543.1 unnamed protein product [Callosobruchus analis]
MANPSVTQNVTQTTMILAG